MKLLGWLVRCVHYILSTRTLFFVFKNGVPPLLNVSVTVLYVAFPVDLDLLLSGFSFFPFGFVTFLDWDFGLDLGFTVLINTYYSRYRFQKGFDLRSNTMLLDENPSAVLLMWCSNRLDQNEPVNYLLNIINKEARGRLWPLGRSPGVYHVEPFASPKYRAATGNM